MRVTLADKWRIEKLPLETMVRPIQEPQVSPFGLDCQSTNCAAKAVPASCFGEFQPLYAHRGLEFIAYKLFLEELARLLDVSGDPLPSVSLHDRRPLVTTCL